MSGRRTRVDMQLVDGRTGWQALAGFVGREANILSDDLNGAAGTGGRTQLVRFAVGAATTRTLVHDYWEEVYMLSGDLRLLEEAGRSATAPACSCRLPGTPHVPFLSETECVLLEMRFYLR